MSKENRYKNQKAEGKEETAKVGAKSASQQKNQKKSSPSRISKIRKDERSHKLAGLFLVALSLYLGLAFLSYFFTHSYDQSLLQSDTTGQVKNWAGKVGMFISHFAVMRLGIGVFILIPFLFFSGLNLLTQSKYISQLKLVLMSLSGFIWLSTLLAAIIPDGSSLDVLHGKFGWGMESLLTGWLGRVGLWALLIVSIGVYGIIAFNMSFSFINSFVEKWKATSWLSSKPKEELSSETEPIDEAQQWAEAAEIAANKFAPEKKKEPESIEPSIEEDPFILTNAAAENEEEKIPESLIENLPEESEMVSELPIEPEVPEVPEEQIEETKREEDSGEIIFSLDPSPVNKLAKSSEEPTFTIAESKEEEIVDQLHEKEDDFNLDTPYDPTLDLPNFKMPDADLLAEHGSGGIKINKEELEANKDKIVNTLNNYNIQIDQIKATVGPTVTLYEIVPAPGVRISKIKNLEDDIALSLAALGIRIIAPIPGKGTIGIEVPNQNPEVVSMRSIIMSEKFAKSTFDLPIGLGKTISNETFVADLAKMPHLLMAGATGQGKSVGLNAILVSLLYKKHPSQLKFVLVDPKKVELTLFNTIEKHYLAKLPGEEEAIITNTQKVINTVNSLCIEMDLRYDLLKQAGVRQLKEYNAKFIARKLNPNKGHRFLPYIVLVVDEFADLIMTAGKEVELPIARLAQLARAVGIHLIIATQRPSVNIITGTIKANFPARIAFRVSSKIDSRTILDAGGAEQLIGRGDMLLSLGSDLVRLQCAFVDTPEVEQLTEFIGNQRGYSSAFELPEYESEESGGKGDFSINDRDSLFEDAARIIVSTQQGSTSMLQRRLKLGYNRAGRIMDQLEAAGIVGQSEGSKPRQVLFTDEVSLEQFLDTLK